MIVYFFEMALDRARPVRIFEINEKLISKFVGQDLEFCYDNQNLYVLNTGCVVLTLNQTRENIKYMMGVLNSKLMNFYFRQIFTDYREAFPIVKSGHLEQLPIRTIDLNNPDEKRIHDRMVQLVDRMLELHKHKHQAKSDSEKELFEHQIKVTDREIDDLVYKLYWLSKEDILVIEEGSAR